MFGLGFRFPQLAAGGSSLTEQIRELFANGEQGGYWDFTSPEGMYQDSAGTTPITALGQPVGLVLDRRFGLARGARMDVNGDTLVGWAVQTPAVTPVSYVDGICRVGRTEAGAGGPYQDVAVPAGGVEVTFRARNIAGGGSGHQIAVYVGGGFGTPLGGVTVTSLAGEWQEGALRIPAGNVRVYARAVYDSGAGANSAFEVDYIRVREVPGNPLSQATTAARPTYTVDGALHDGVDDFLMAANAADWTFLHDGTGGYMSASSEYREGGGLAASYFGTQTASGLSIGVSTGFQSIGTYRTLSRVSNGDELAPGTINTPTDSYPLGLMGTQEFEVSATGTRAWSLGDLYRDEPFGDFVPSTEPPSFPLRTQIAVNGTSVVRRRMLAISRVLTNDELALVRGWLMEGVE